MEKLNKRTVAILAIVVFLGVTILTLGLIKIKPYNYFFTDYKYFQVYNLGSSSQFADIGDTVGPQLNTVGFSLLGAILEGQGGYAPRIEKDDEGEPKYLNATYIKEISATAERYLLHFVYEDIRVISVGGVDYEYNRAYVFIAEGSGEIVETRVIPYVFERVHNDSDWDGSSQLYEIADLRIKMRTSKLFVTIQNTIKEF